MRFFYLSIEVLSLISEPPKKIHFLTIENKWIFIYFKAKSIESWVLYADIFLRISGQISFKYWGIEFLWIFNIFVDLVVGLLLKVIVMSAFILSVETLANDLL